MTNQSINFLLIPLLFGIFITHVYAESPIYSWRVSDLARSPVEHIKLRNEQDRLIKTVSAKQMVYLYAAMSSIAEASEIHAEFLIVDGTLANAFTGSTEDGANFIAINFAMLDILGTNLDMTAALIGHELAHLKLNHGEISKKNLELNHGKDFSAANTRYSRDNEREADYLGAIWAVEAGYDPSGAVALQEALYAQSKKIAFLSFNVSHPSSIERITILKSLVRRLSN
jgi:predicted Zn-dependent protease